MIYFTGDTHGHIDTGKLSGRAFPLQKRLTREDFLIICGDFGCIWDGGSRDKWWLDWYQRKNFTTLFVDGNHENHPLLNRYPVEMWNGGKVHRIRKNILHLMRGQVYNIDGQTLFTFGGAPSHDLWARKLGVSWWPEEVASEAEIAEARANLDRVGWKVDYIVTHTVSARMIREELTQLMPLDIILNPTEDFLSEVEEKAEWKMWFAGHFHRDMIIWRRNTCLLYQKVRALTDELTAVNDPRK
ncbi:MAG: metallophosphoesterase [Oscillospiraceae bacterium]|nr:metallophosphoesterase [Oscillospiraceae bacterium]